jgi:hypothetical protein
MLDFDESDLNKNTSELASKQQASEELQPKNAQTIAKNKFSFLNRIKLDIIVNAPIIIIPEQSSSLNALLLDCGLIKIKTNLDILDHYYDKLDLKNHQTLNHRLRLPPIIECQKVTLSNMEISRVVLEETDLNIKSEIFLVDCSDLNVNVRRNLQPKIYEKFEPISVEVIYGGLLVSIDQSDYTFILNLLQTMNEKPSESTDLPSLSKSEIETRKPTKKDASSSYTQDALENIGPLTDNNSHDVPEIVIRVFVQSIKMRLHNDAIKTIETHQENSKIKRIESDTFSKMELKNLQLELKIFKDTYEEKNKSKIQFLLDDITLCDNRLNEKTKRPIR